MKKACCIIPGSFFSSDIPHFMKSGPQGKVVVKRSEEISLEPKLAKPAKARPQARVAKA